MSDALRPTVLSVQRLVRALVEPSGAVHAADDAAQEAWLAALRKGIAGPEATRWLAGAARRFVRSMRRDEARRRERERIAGRAERVEDVHAVAERTELARRVVQAVHELDEPFRTAVVMRYFDGLPPRAIARSLGVPVNTARSRVRRGIERLRERLGPAGLVALLPGPVRPGGLRDAPRTVAAAPWVAGAASLVAVTVLVTGGVLLVRAPARTPPAERPARPDTTAFDAAVTERASGAERVAERELALPGAATSGATALEAGASERASASARGVVRGRLLDELGRPLSGESLALDLLIYQFTGPGNVPVSGMPEGVDSWEAPAGESDARGEFALAFDVVAGTGVELAITRPGGMRIGWIWRDVAPGAELDVGVVRIARGGTLEGRVVGAALEPYAGVEWQVSLDPVASVPAGAPEVRGTVLADAVDGSFRFEGVPAGRYELDAYAAEVGRITGPDVELAGHGLQRVDVVHAGPDPRRSVRVTVSVPQFPALRIADDAVGIVSRDGQVRAIRKQLPSAWQVDELEPGEYSIVIEDPRFVPWRRDGVTPGTRLHAELAGNAALRLQAFERDGVGPIDALSIRLDPADPDGSAVVPRTERALEDGVLAGLVPGSYVLSVVAPGFGSETREVLDLAAGETRTLTFALAPAKWISGTVRCADGRALAGAEVACLEPAPLGDSDASPILGLGMRARGEAASMRREVARARTDASGTFRVELPRSGTYVLAVITGSHEVRASSTVAAGADRGVAGVELVLPGDCP